jgi:meckelin
MSEPPEQVFIDVCTIAKVSLFALQERYWGFYVHCRSPYPQADDSMEEIVNHLKQEEAGLMVERTLDGGPPNVQSFEIFVTDELRKRYDNVFLSSLASGAQSIHDRPPSRAELNTRCGRRTRMAALPEQLLKARRDANKFLQVRVCIHTPRCAQHMVMYRTSWRTGSGSPI